MAVIVTVPVEEVRTHEVRGNVIVQVVDPSPTVMVPVGVPVPGRFATTVTGIV